MRVDEVLIKLKELGAKSSLSAMDKNEIKALYSEVLDKNFKSTSCNDCYKDAVIEMTLYIKKHGKMKEKCSYKLKNGVIIQLEFGKEYYSNANLTDEIAEKYLTAYPSRSNVFAVLPEDWKLRITKKEVKETKPKK